MKTRKSQTTNNTSRKPASGLKRVKLMNYLNQVHIFLSKSFQMRLVNNIIVIKIRVTFLVKNLCFIILFIIPLI